MTRWSPMVGCAIAVAGSVAAGKDSMDLSGGATGRASTGNKCEFCAAHFAAKPLRGLLVLYS
jgi:hypothetical protein